MSQPTNSTPGGHGHKDSAAATIWMAVSGASANDHHEAAPGVDGTSKQVGHEPDRFNATTIWFVPVLVAVTMLMVYGVVQGVFSLFVGTTAEQKDIPNYNDRVTRIATTDAKPVKDGLPAVAQPRLEFVQKMDLTRNDVNGNIVTDPPYMRSFKRTPTGNSPEIYPEDLRAEHFVDPTSKTNALVDASWATRKRPSPCCLSTK